MAETQMSTVAVIDALLTRDLLDWTRNDLNGFRNEAVAGSLSAADEKYVRQLYARIPPLKTPYVPTVRPNYASYPIEPKLARWIHRADNFGWGCNLHSNSWCRWHNYVSGG